MNKTNKASEMITLKCCVLRTFNELVITKTLLEENTHKDNFNRLKCTNIETDQLKKEKLGQRHEHRVGWEKQTVGTLTVATEKGDGMT